MLIQELLPEHRKNNHTFQPEKIIFEGVSPKDVYNISSEFEFNGYRYILGRVESRQSEKSETCFFKKVSSSVYVLDLEAPILKLQDPFYTFVDGELIVGGVEVRPKKATPNEMEWRTVFYKGCTFSSFSSFFEGPYGMKDLRIKELTDGRILVLTRPQGEKGGRGKIGFGIVPDLASLSIAMIEEAPLLKNQFDDKEWGGANEIHLLSENCVGVLGHIACFDENKERHYYAMTFELDLISFELSRPQIIAERSDFLSGPAKRPDLEDVVFSGGLLMDGAYAILYAGIGDAEAQKIRLANPFSK